MNVKQLNVIWAENDEPLDESFEARVNRINCCVSVFIRDAGGWRFCSLPRSLTRSLAHSFAHSLTFPVDCRRKHGCVCVCLCSGNVYNAMFRQIWIESCFITKSWIERTWLTISLWYVYSYLPDACWPLHRMSLTKDFFLFVSTDIHIVKIENQIFILRRFCLLSMK